MTSAIGSLAIVALCGASLAGCSAHLLSPTSSSTPPVLTSLQPSQGAVGTTISIHGSGLSGTTSVQFGPSAYATQTDVNDTTVMFTAPRTSNPCGLSTTPCGAGTAILITPGVYNVTVTTAAGTSNALAFTVTP